jgi:alanyl-tRNA synthetase/misacylated tRNA(Ala) deacylase
MKMLYYEDKNLKEVESDIDSYYQEDGRYCIQLSDNIFYPQGGGQKGDRGTLTIDGNEFQVVNTLKDKYGDGAVLIIEPDIPEELQDSKVKAVLDWDFRYKQMRLHTCVHLHHCMLEEVTKKPINHPETSVIEDGFAFNRYSGGDFDVTIIDEANAKFLETLKTGAPVTTYPDTEKKGFRWWECLGHKIPCGGIHVSQLGEIGDVRISTSTKKGKITIKFTL